MHVVFKKSCAKKSTHISSFHRKYVCSSNWLVCIMVRIGLFSHKMFIAIDRISLLSEQKYSSLGRSEMGELISNKCKNHIQQFFCCRFVFCPFCCCCYVFVFCPTKICYSIIVNWRFPIHWKSNVLLIEKTNAVNLFIALIRSECLNL